jgi:hypothetical protein
MLDKLIDEGAKVRQSCIHGSGYEAYMTGEDYEKWISKGILYMEKEHPKETLTVKFIKASETAVGNGPEYFDKMMGILKALKEYEE